jgi:multidrug efflux pump subunit AcrB
MKGAIAWFAENHVAANLLMLFLLLAGIITGLSIKLEVFPETSLDMINISTVYPGASPAEVEESVVRRIEEKIAGLAGIKRIDSTVRESYGSVTVEVMKGWDLKKLLDEVKAEVDRITTFPDEAEQPVIRELTRRSQVINLAVFGDASEATLKHLAEKVKDDITNLPGVTLAEISAARDNEIHIEIPEATLRQYNLTLGQVAQVVAKGSLDLPAGRVKTSNGDILVRTKGRRYNAADYHDIAVITSSDGARVTLGQIAKLSDGFANVDLLSRFQGKPAIMINVYRVADQSALKVAAIVKKYIDEEMGGLPKGVDVRYYVDRSKILHSRISLLTKNMAFGLLLVTILLGLFLNIRLAFWVTLGIPVSFAAGMAFLPQFDVSLNMISLFAFIMVLGIVVDDAIIVGENIFQLNEKGNITRLEAAVEGTVEVGRPVVFSVLTTIVAFYPIAMAGGMMGKMLRAIPIVVMLVLAGSLIESLFILPAHLARSRALKSPNHRKKLTQRLMESIINGPYARMIDFCIQWRYATLSFGIAILILTVGISKAGWVKFTFLPKVEGDTLQCLLTMPSGTPVTRTSEVAEHLEKVAIQMLKEEDKKRLPNAPSLMEYSSSLVGAQFGRHGSGSSGAHLAQVWVQLLDGEQRDVSSMELSKLWRKKAGRIPDAETIMFKSEIHSAGNAIEVHLSMDDHDSLVEAAEKLKSELEGYSGVFDIGDSFLPGKKEMQLKLKPSANILGLTLNDLALQVRHAFYGAEALRFQRDKNEIKVLVRYPESERRYIGNVEAMRIRLPEGIEVPFSQVAEITMRQGYSSIDRAQRLRVIKVSADVDEDVANANEVRQYLEKEFLPNLKNLYPGLRFDIGGEGKEQKETLGDLGRGFIIALFCIYALLAVPFKSFTQPIIVMGAIPFGIVGAIFGHLLMGFNVSIVSLFGIIGLTGVVVNDSLVLISRINRLREQGFNVRDAVTKGGTMRFRAIILTSLTTFAGLTPILLERSIQARFLIPMAVSLGFGVLFATGITLILVPCGYMVLEDVIDTISVLKNRMFGQSYSE